MPTSWRDGLVNAFPVPQDRRKLKKSSKKGNYEIIPVPAVSVPLTEEILPIADPFPFFELPAEIRNRIYRFVLFSEAGYRGLDGWKTARTPILAVNKRTHEEASYILYSSLSFRIFPLQEFTSTPTIGELRPLYRAMVGKLEMVVGSSWTDPPKSWRVSKLIAKRLSKLTRVETLRVFVQCDPSSPEFEKYRISLDFYTDFCGDLLRDVLVTMPHLTAVDVDGNPGVEASGPLVSRLVTEAQGKGKLCTVARTKTIVTPFGTPQVFW